MLDKWFPLKKTGIIVQGLQICISTSNRLRKEPTACAQSPHSLWKTREVLFTYIYIYIYDIWYMIYDIWCVYVYIPIILIILIHIYKYICHFSVWRQESLRRYLRIPTSTWLPQASYPCGYTYIYIYMYMHPHIYIYIHMCTYTYIYIYVYIEREIGIDICV